MLSRLKAWAACLLVGLVAVVWVWAHWPEPRETVYYWGDGLFFLAMARTAADGNVEYLHPRLAAPEGADWRHYPILMPLEYSLVRWMARLGLPVPDLLYPAWLIIVAVTAALTCAGYRSLGFSPVLAGGLGLLFTLQPIGLLRNLYQINLVYPLVGFLAAATIIVARGGWPERVPRSVLLLFFLQGLSFVYNSFFLGWLLLAATAAGSLLEGRRAARQGAACLAALALGLFVYACPVLSYQAEHGVGSIYRTPLHAEIMGLKLRHLICPRPLHPLAPLAKLESRLLAEQNPAGEGDSDLSRLGSLGTLGLLAAGALLFAGAAGVRPAWARPVALPAALLLGVLLLLGVTGGLGTVFNILVSSAIRGYNRAVVLIDFFALAVVGAGLARLTLRRQLAVLLLLVPLALVDETWEPYSVTRPLDAYPSDREFVSLLERELPPGAAVFQLPVGSFPVDTQPQGKMLGYDGVKPYLHSRHLRWSWGLQNDAQDGWHRWAAELPPARLRQALLGRGFTALWVDTWGYVGREAELQRLNETFGLPSWENESGRYRVYDLRQERGEGPISTPPLPDLRVRLQVVETAPWWVGAVKVKLTNLSDATLTSNPPHPVNLCYHWVSPTGQMEVYEGKRTPIRTLAPGASTVTWVEVAPPPTPGPHKLLLRVVQEGVAWQDAGPELTVGSP